MTILAAIDENPRSQNVVEVAYDLATTYDDTLVALHVVPEEDFEAHKRSLADNPEFHDFSLAQEADSARRIARRVVVDTVDDVDRSRLDPRGRVGDIADEILAEADRLDPRFLVIGGRRRSPVGKALFGNTAQQILLKAECPVVSRLTDA
ncbi:MAG: universal stress protein [Halobacteriales archaeon]